MDSSNNTDEYKNKVVLIISLMSDYIDNMNDLSSLTLAVEGCRYQPSLYYAWMKVLKSDNTPLVLIQLDSKYSSEKECLEELYKDTLNKIINLNNKNNDNKNKKKKYDPRELLLTTLNTCKNTTTKTFNKYINKARGPMPEKYTDDFEDWEGYDDSVHGYNKAIAYENFWKDGGREGKATTKEYSVWEEAGSDTKKRWIRVLDDTMNIIKNDGNEQIKILLKGHLTTRTGRKLMLKYELSKVGLTLRNDSTLCKQFIQYNHGNVKDITKIMLEMNFLITGTNYNTMLRNQRENNRYFNDCHFNNIYDVADHEITKILDTKKFIQDHPNNTNEIPPTLLNKVQQHDNKINFERDLKQ